MKVTTYISIVKFLDSKIVNIDIITMERIYGK